MAIEIVYACNSKIEWSRTIVIPQLPLLPPGSLIHAGGRRCGMPARRSNEWSVRLDVFVTTMLQVRTMSRKQTRWNRKAVRLRRPNARETMDKLQRMWCAGIDLRQIRYRDILGYPYLRNMNVIPGWGLVPMLLFVAIPPVLRERYELALAATLFMTAGGVAMTFLTRCRKYRAIQG